MNALNNACLVATQISINLIFKPASWKMMLTQFKTAINTEFSTVKVYKTEILMLQLYAYNAILVTRYKSQKNLSPMDKDAYKMYEKN
jgi:hypothetical protein